MQVNSARYPNVAVSVMHLDPTPAEQARMASARTMSQERKRIVSAYVRDRLNKEEASQGRGYPATVADAIGVSRPTVSNIRKGSRGVGIEFSEAIAEFWGMDLQGLFRAANEWWAKRHPEAPNREAVIQLMADELYPEVLSYLRQVELPRGDLSKESWFDLARAKQTELRILKAEEKPEPKPWKAPRAK